MIDRTLRADVPRERLDWIARLWLLAVALAFIVVMVSVPACGESLKTQFAPGQSQADALVRQSKTQAEIAEYLHRIADALDRAFPPRAR